MKRILYILRHPVTSCRLAHAFYRLGGCIQPRPSFAKRCWIGFAGTWAFSGDDADADTGTMPYVA